MTFLKNSKNRIILYMILLAIISLSFGFYYKAKWTEFEYGKDCWLWVIDENGNGFGDVINHCPQTKANCEASYHNLTCKWIEGRKLVDNEGNAKRSVEGCECKYEIISKI